MNIRMDLSDLVGLYAKATLSITGRVANRLIAGFQDVFSVDDALKYDYFKEKAVGYAKVQRYRRAADLLQQLHKIKPEDGEVKLYLGLSLIKLGEAESGIEHLEALQEQEPGNLRIISVLAVAHLQLEQFAKALPYLRQLEVEQPKDCKTKLRLAQIYEQMGDRAAAIQCYQQVLVLQPDDAETRQLLEAALKADGQHAATEAQRVEPSSTNTPEAGKG